jgi:ABC-type nitrate/sulfonate/bicarbonate transport system substrate-binding protein
MSRLARPKLLRTPLSALYLLLACALVLTMSTAPASAHPEKKGGGPRAVDMTPAEIDFGVFYDSLPMLAAEAEGFWDKYNLTVNYLRVEGSVQQFDYLNRGLYDIVQTSPDNVANYRYNPTTNPLGVQIPAQIFMGIDYGLNLRVVARPGIENLEDLEGAELAVDAPDSGFAYLLYEILGNVGLERDVDYDVVESGGVGARFRALLEDEFDATLLCCGLSELALAEGMTWPEGGLAQDTIEPYHGVVGAADERWIEQNPDVLLRFIRAHYEASQWTFDPANRERAIELLMDAQSVERERAEEIYELSIDPRIGLVPDASLNREAILNTLQLREKFGGFETDLDPRREASPASGLYDLSYYHQALRPRGLGVHDKGHPGGKYQHGHHAHKSHHAYKSHKAYHGREARHAHEAHHGHRDAAS